MREGRHHCRYTAVRGRRLGLSIGGVLAVLASCGCTPSKIATPAQSNPLYEAPQAHILSQTDTISLEFNDRIARFKRLATLDGVTPPEIEPVYTPAGSVPGVIGPIPVVRVVFPEDAFFNTDSATPLPKSLAIIQLIAQNMRRDVPDAALTILGHTDATGTDAYNMELSKRRALAVMAILARLGAEPQQMTTVAIGEHQPIAPNDTDRGRALNRRVEFLISASTDANLSVVQRRKINGSFFSTGTPNAPPPMRLPSSVPVLQGAAETGDEMGLVTVGPLELSTPTINQAAVVVSKPAAPPPQVTMRPATPVAPAPLSNIVVH